MKNEAKRIKKEAKKQKKQARKAAKQEKATGTLKWDSQSLRKLIKRARTQFSLQPVLIILAAAAALMLMTWPSLMKQLERSTRLPSTRMWPWLTICFAAKMVGANPAWYTSASRRWARKRKSFSSV
jgi:hypothetical protein